MKPLPLLFPLAAVAMLLSAPRAPAQVAAGSEVYSTYCAVCHGDDGLSKTEEGQRKGARDLTKRKWQNSVTDARLTEAIAKGKGKMPAFGRKLSAEEIKALVAEVRRLAR